MRFCRHVCWRWVDKARGPHVGLQSMLAALRMAQDMDLALQLDLEERQAAADHNLALRLQQEEEVRFPAYEGRVLGRRESLPRLFSEI